MDDNIAALFAVKCNEDFIFIIIIIIFVLINVNLLTIAVFQAEDSATFSTRNWVIETHHKQQSF